jgi:hypothetical protein
MNWRAIFLTTVLGMVGLVGLSVASMGTKIRPKVTIQTVETNKETGIVVLQLTAEVWTDVHEIEIRAFGDSGIVPSGYQSFSMMTDGRDTVCFPISLVVPMADTTQVLFFMVEKTGKEGWNSRTFVVPGQHGGVDTLRQAPHFGDETFVVGQLYFIRTSDTLIVTDTDPGYSETINMHVETPNARSIPYEPGQQIQQTDSIPSDSVGTYDTLRGDTIAPPPGAPQQSYSTRTGFYLEDGTFVSAENMTDEERRTFSSTHKLFRRDADKKSEPADATIPSSVEDQWRQLRELEKDTLWETDAQTVFVDGKPYVRRKGECLFREQQVITDLNAYLLERRRLRQQEAETMVRIRIECLNRDDSVTVSRLVDTLFPTDQVNVYEANVLTAIKYELRKAGIKFYRVDREKKTPGAQSDSSATTGETEPPPILPSLLSDPQEDRDTVFMEYFESSFPGTRWSVFDNDNLYSNDDYWGQKTCLPHSGSYSLWCSGHGDDGEQSACNWYAYQMQATLNLLTPINVTDREGERVEFWYWNEVANGDNCDFMWSSDGETWAIWPTTLGNTNGAWVHFSYDLGSGAGGWAYSALYLMWIFESGNGSNTENGFFLDDITVTTLAGPKSDLTSYWPVGWSGDMVLSMVPNTNSEDDPLLNDRPTYLDWAVSNDGEAGSWSNPSITTLQVNGVHVVSFPVPALACGQRYECLDYARTYLVGHNYLELVFNADSSVRETNYLNNNTVASRWWETPAVILPNFTVYAIYPANQCVVGCQIASDVPTFFKLQYRLEYADVAKQWTDRIYLDNVLVYSQVKTVMHTYNGGETAGGSMYVTPGYHTVRGVVDANNNIAETNESDNTISRTFYCSGPTVTVSGGPIRYRDANVLNAGTSGYWRPLVGYPVQLWDYDAITPDNLLAVTTLDSRGTFSFASVSNSETPGGKRDIYVRIPAAKGAVWVTGSSEDTLCLMTDTIDNVPSGTYDYGAIDLSLASSEQYFVADNIQRNYDVWLSLRPDAVPDRIRVALGNWTCGSCYDTSDFSLRLGRNKDVIRCLPDTWDHYVLAHEYAHHFEFQFSFLKEGSYPSHYWQQPIPPGNRNLVSGEAFANFWAGYFTDNVMLYNKWTSANDRLVFHEYYDLENGVMGDNVHLFPDTADLDLYFCNQWGGLDCDGPVSCIFWDIYDNQNDDQSTPGVTEPLPDGIGDTISLGIQPILRALLDRYVTEDGIDPHHPQTMQEFMYTWNMRDSSLGHTKALKDIFYEHGYTDCGFGMTGNVNNSASEIPSIGDASMLIDRLFLRGPQIGCTQEADCNGDNTVNIGDISMLIDYLFVTNQPLAACK